MDEPYEKSSHPIAVTSFPKEPSNHPYLSGNFAPIQNCLPLTPCSYTGTIPPDLAGGQYVRNGGNPLANDDPARTAHWFDGDGMLSGVLFRRRADGSIIPEFVNQYLQTDVYGYAKRSRSLTRPVLPSIATLVDPASSFLHVIFEILRTVLLVVLSRFQGAGRTIKKISVANTSVLYHDGRALATCESGPPLRFTLPSLETVGWYNGNKAENEPLTTTSGDTLGGDGPLSWMREWTTAHPRVDPVTNELISYHSTFVAPFVRYSVIQPRNIKSPKAEIPTTLSLFNKPIPGISSPKMMHDFGVSATHTVILDLPLSLDPSNLLRGIPSLTYDSTCRSRFGVFPRHNPERIRWFETNPCIIFHTANCWTTPATPKTEATVHLLACRLTSASMVFSAGNLPTPAVRPVPPEYAEEEQCRLYYFSFPLGDIPSPAGIKHQWALSAISFEFPTVAPGRAMHDAHYVYGCTTGQETYAAPLGEAAKIDHLAKIDVAALIARGVARPAREVKGCVDVRTVREIMADDDPLDPVRLFEMPEGWYAQEPRFVPKVGAQSEDDGFLLTYVFDEAQLDEKGACRPDSVSELWVIDARGMRDVVAKVRLPQRVPYGLHGNWFSEEDISGQIPYDTVREPGEEHHETGWLAKVREMCEEWLG
ncbi:hypothetical protein ACHAQH_004018 [Verticillium albo-atrum]